MPQTIADGLQRIIDAKTDIDGAIEAKGGIVTKGLENSDDDIMTIPSGGGGGSQPRKDVNFYDYDGTIVQSYSAADFANISELPANPTHEGLTAQGWNWSLSDAKTYVASYGKLNIGQMYITSDGKTKLYISLTEGRTSPILQLYLNDNSELDIDWGDGGTHSTFTTTSEDYKSERHEYSTAGDYVIAITVVNGGFVLQSSSRSVSSILWNGNISTSSPDRAYNNAIKKVEIGGGVISIGDNAFNGCSSLSSVTIPDTVTSIGDYAFSNCYSLSSITIPDSVTGIGSFAFNGCSALSSVTIPDSVTSIGGSAFRGCFSLSSITIPDSVTGIGGSAFNGCYSLSSITIPDSVTSISNGAFQNCSYMSYIKFKSTTPPTVLSSNAWNGVSTSTLMLVPTTSYESYITGTNYPSASLYTYLVFGTYASGASLPEAIPDSEYSLVWYASMADAVSETNPITVGNGNEVYARAVEVV